MKNGFEIKQEEIKMVDYSKKGFEELANTIKYLEKNSQPVGLSSQLLMVNLSFEKPSLKVNKSLEKNLDSFLRLFKGYSNLGKSLDFTPVYIFLKVTTNDSVVFSKEMEENISKVNKIFEDTLIKYSNCLEIFDEFNQDGEELISLSEFEEMENFKKVDSLIYTKSLMDIVKKISSFTQYLLEGSNADNIHSDLKLDVDFQRELVWDLEKKKNYILSILKNLPTGTIYINSFNIYSEIKKEEYKNHDEVSLVEELSEINDLVYDGKQRLSAILSFLKNEFSININGTEVYYKNIKKIFFLKLSTYNVDVVETKFTNKNDLIHYYIEINKSREVHTVEHLQKALDCLN